MQKIFTQSRKAAKLLDFFLLRRLPFGELSSEIPNAVISAWRLCGLRAFAWYLNGIVTEGERVRIRRVPIEWPGQRKCRGGSIL